MSTAKDRFIAALALQLGVRRYQLPLAYFVEDVNTVLDDTGTRIVDEPDAYYNPDMVADLEALAERRERVRAEAASVLASLRNRLIATAPPPTCTMMIQSIQEHI